jgi:glycosyltransferase A (GT-A) superfamily protein (DUF2064 family)
MGGFVRRTLVGVLVAFMSMTVLAPHEWRDRLSGQSRQRERHDAVLGLGGDGGYSRLGMATGWSASTVGCSPLVTRPTWALSRVSTLR